MMMQTRMLLASAVITRSPDTSYGHIYLFMQPEMSLLLQMDLTSNMEPHTNVPSGRDYCDTDACSWATHKTYCIFIFILWDGSEFTEH